MVDVISRDELKAAIDAGTVTVVDTLGGSYYAARHLPTAIELVETDVDIKAAKLLPDKSASIITYCSNPACPNSDNVAKRLIALGYTNVRKYRDGIEDWVAAGLPVESAGYVGSRRGLGRRYPGRAG